MPLLIVVAAAGEVITFYFSSLRRLPSSHTHTKAFDFSPFFNLLKTSRLPIEAALKILLFCLKLCETLRTGRKRLCSRGSQNLKASKGRQRKHSWTERPTDPKRTGAGVRGGKAPPPLAPPLRTCASGLVPPSPLTWPLVGRGVAHSPSSVPDFPPARAQYPARRT